MLGALDQTRTNEGRQMKLAFSTTELADQWIVGIRASVELAKIADAMGQLFPELFGYVQQHGGSPSGMPLTLYHCIGGNSVELECALPIAAPIAGTKRIRCSELPSGTMATVTHVGPYENLSGTWAALTEWMDSEGLIPAGTPWEVYVTDPGAEPDQSKWRTDIFFPVRSRSETSWRPEIFR